jgi:hypothetical protein
MQLGNDRRRRKKEARPGHEGRSARSTLRSITDNLRFLRRGGGGRGRHDMVFLDRCGCRRGRDDMVFLDRRGCRTGSRDIVINLVLDRLASAHE